MKDILKQIFLKNYYKPIGLIIGIILVFFLIIVIDAFICKYITNQTITLLLYAGIEICWVITWWNISYALPKNIKKKIGILVAFSSENDKQKTRIKQDYIKKILSLLEKHNLQYLFNIISLSDYKAERVSTILNNYLSKKNEIFSKIATHQDVDLKKELKKAKELKTFNKIKKRLRCHFFIWGTIKERLDKENKYFINQKGLVLHKPVTIPVSNKIAIDFSRILASEISFFDKIESMGFEIASNLTYIGVRYIVGLAAFISGDFSTAFSLHNNLKSEFKKINPLPQPLKSILDNLNDLLLSEISQRIRFFYLIKKDYQQVTLLIKEADKMNDKYYDILVFKSLFAFEINKNIDEAISYTYKAKTVAHGDYTWLYNRAFLFMYSHRFEEGYKDYQKLSSISFIGEDSIVNICIKFNLDILDKNPNIIQSHFILGFLYFKKKKDYHNALEQFQLFESKCSIGKEYKFLLIRTKSFIGELKLLLVQNNKQEEKNKKRNRGRF